MGNKTIKVGIYRDECLVYGLDALGEHPDWKINVSEKFFREYRKYENLFWKMQIVLQNKYKKAEPKELYGTDKKDR